jgi:hypothetical protein
MMLASLCTQLCGKTGLFSANEFPKKRPLGSFSTVLRDAVPGFVGELKWEGDGHFDVSPVDLRHVE